VDLPAPPGPTSTTLRICSGLAGTGADDDSLAAVALLTGSTFLCADPPRKGTEGPPQRAWSGASRQRMPPAHLPSAGVRNGANGPQLTG